MGIIKHIEQCGRICYKSEVKITDESYKTFIRNVISRGHESVLEHASFTIKFICDRGISHELVRHRIASFSQESTRYCNYSKEAFGSEITVIQPFFFQPGTRGFEIWKTGCEQAEKAYFALLDQGYTAQEARSVLPNSLKTEVVMTANLREWRHFLRLRCDPAAHPQMREITLPLLTYLRSTVPVIFDDIGGF